MYVSSPWQIYRLRSCAKEPETVAWLERELRAGDSFYDVGANVGAYSLVAAAIGYEAVRVIAFEPGFGTFAELCRNIDLNGFQNVVTPLPLALGERSGLLGFEYSDTTPGAARHSWARDASAGSSTVETVVSTIVHPLDRVIVDLSLPKPNLLKIDVDGPELGVLAGAAETISSPELRGVLIELDDNTQTAASATQLLEHAGFSVRSRHSRGGDPTLHNVIFAR
jgi:FkbM family methyltransferase